MWLSIDAKKTQKKTTHKTNQCFGLNTDNSKDTTVDAADSCDFSKRRTDMVTNPERNLINDPIACVVD